MKTLGLVNAGVCFLGLQHAILAQTAADSGWVNLFNGTNFNGLYVYAVGTGVVNIPADSTRVRIGTQTTPIFQVDSARIRVGGSPNGYIGTVRQYGYYHVRVQYMWPTGTSATANAGLLINLDSAQVRSTGFANTNNRPRSIEVNMKRDLGHPWSLWAASALGPTITTNVQDSSIAIPLYQAGGVQWVANPSGKRTIASTLTNPELPLGQWNQGEAYMYGADSGVFVLNGQIRTRGSNFRNTATSVGSATAPRYSRGNIGLQSEGAPIFYRNFQIQLIDSATLKPVALLNRERSQRLSGQQLINASMGLRWVEIPKGYSGIALYNLKGRLVWTFKGSNIKAMIPDGVETGILRARFLP